MLFCGATGVLDCGGAGGGPAPQRGELSGTAGLTFGWLALFELMMPSCALPSLFVLLAAVTLSAFYEGDAVRGNELLTERFQNMDRNGNWDLPSDEIGRMRLIERSDANGAGSVTMAEACAFVQDRTADTGDGSVWRRQFGASATPYANGPETDEAAPSPPGLADVFLATAIDDNLTVHRDIPYEHVAGVDPNLVSLDIYGPATGTAATGDLRPVVVMIHGGGWQFGDKAGPYIGFRKAATFVSNGFMYVAINYRLSPSVRYATQAGDVAKALAWVVQNISHYSGDPRRIYIMGHSAGAHLAALVTTDESYLTREGLSLKAISGVVLLDTGAYDIPWVMGHIAGRGQELYDTAFGNDPKSWANASPINHISAGKGIPSMLVLYVNRPRSADVSRRFAQALKGAGVSAAAVEAHGKDHRSINLDIGKSGDAETRIILEFLRGKSLSEMPESI